MINEASPQFIPKPKSEKNRWYLLKDNHSVGPFTWEQLSLQFESGLHSEQSFIWNPELSEWETYESILKRPSSSIPTPQFKFRNFENTEGLETKTANTIERRYDSIVRRKKQKKIASGVILFLITFSSVFIYFRNQSQRIAELKNVLPETESKDIEQFIKKKGVFKDHALLSISKENGRTPTFYLLSHEPNDTQIEIKLTSQNGGILGQIHYQQQQNIGLKQEWGKTLPFSNFNQAELPRGTYVVTAKNVTTGAELAKRSYFLGGPKDEAFQQELSAFNRKLERRVKQEQVELKQFITTLESQFADQNQWFHQLVQFQKSHSGAPPSSSAQEEAMWLELQGQLNNLLSQYTETILNQNVYHSELYLLTKQTVLELNSLHQKQHEWFESLQSQNKNKLEEILKHESEVQSRIIELQARFQQALTQS